MSYIVGQGGASVELIIDMVGAALVDSASIDFTYDDPAGTITATVIQAGIDHGSIGGLSDDDHAQYFKVTGRTNESLTLSGNGVINATAGSAAAPSINFGDAGTGFLKNATNQIGVTLNGTQQMLWDSSGHLKPVTNNSKELGALATQFANVYSMGFICGSLGATSLTVASLTLGNSTRIISNSFGNMFFGTSNTDRWYMTSAGHFFAATDAAVDIGSAGANRPNNMHLANQAVVGGNVQFTANADPGAQTNSIAIGAKDATSTNRTLHIRTEEAVAVDIGLASTHSLSVWINNVEYKIALTAV